MHVICVLIINIPFYNNLIVKKNSYGRLNSKLYGLT